MLFNQNLGNVFSIKLKNMTLNYIQTKEWGGLTKNKVILKKIKLRIVNTRS